MNRPDGDPQDRDDAPSADPDASTAADGAPDPAPGGGPERADVRRMVEALLFAAAEPLDERTLAERLPAGADLRGALRDLEADYRARGVNLLRVAGKWMFRTASDLAWLMAREAHETRRLSRPALETLAAIAYHQPVTRAEVEAIRGVGLSKGTLDVLLETGWVRMRGRRRTPGRPVTYGTSEAFLIHFGLDSLRDLPGLEELKGAGLLEGRIPPGFHVPMPTDDPALTPDEDPIEPGELADLLTADEADEPEEADGT
ncbi:SMC-Scp complex subunit ScpB [Hyphomicrobiaceae bacterium 22]|uniref:SMC-Scp complex subunit ScpB n=2 Tax=Prosthecodimorpha staleyi TaxID=2840188 RepID=A0A947D763_9HYPH|nr:SMC-Scp complex subunit ScpB [Prosthecodimorpha staleyi]